MALTTLSCDAKLETSIFGPSIYGHGLGNRAARAVERCLAYEFFDSHHSSSLYFTRSIVHFFPSFNMNIQRLEEYQRLQDMKRCCKAFEQQDL